MQSSNQDRE